MPSKKKGKSKADPPPAPDIDIDSDGFTVCPICNERVNVGTGGIHNLKSHQKSNRCKKIAAAQQKDANTSGNSQQKFMKKFFEPRPTIPKVPPTVEQPESIHSTNSAILPTSDMEAPESLPDVDVPMQALNSDMTSSSFPLPPTSIECLSALRHQILRLPESVPLAGADHPLSQFAGNLHGTIPDGEDAWEVWDRPLNTVLQRDRHDLQLLISRGQYGLPALYNLLYYLATEHNVDSGLFENKIQRILDVIQELMPSSTSETIPHRPASDFSSDSLPVISSSESESTWDTPDITTVDPRTIDHSSFKPSRLSCPGLQITLPPGKSPWSAYPFLFHESLGDPWDIILSAGQLILRARDCQQKMPKECSECFRCSALLKLQSLGGILDRIERGVNQSCPYQYHGAGGLVTLLREKNNEVRALRLNRLGEARKLVRKAKVIDHYKEWVMAVASGRVERVDRLVKIALANGRCQAWTLFGTKPIAACTKHGHKFQKKAKTNR